MNTIDSIDWGARLFGAAIVLGIMWWFGIVTTVHRYKPPPRKRKPVALAGPAIVLKAKPGNDTRPEAEHLPTAGKKPTIVTARTGKAECRRARHDAGGVPTARRRGGRTVARIGARGDQQGSAVTARPVPKRHWRSYGNDPLPTGTEALEEPFNAFPS